MNNLPPDPWKVLGLDKGADKAEIRSTYKKLVLKCHPDKVQDPTLKAQKQDEFQRVQQAYELLIDDAERAKYEEQVKLAELRKQAAMMSKNMSSSPSAARTPTKQYYTYEIRTAEPRFKSASSPHNGPPPSAKVYTQYRASARSWDDDVSPRSQAIYEEERRARRAASYEQPARRDEDRREERRRKEREEERERERERELRLEKEARRAEKKRLEKERDKERKRDVEEKRRHRSPYVEPYEEEPVYTVKVEKKKSSNSKRHDEPPPRERSSSRREHDEPARVDEPRKVKHEKHLVELAASYIERSRSKPSMLRSQTFQEPASYYSPPPATVPVPPAADYVDEDVRRSSARVSSRRPSNEMPSRFKEKSYSSSRKKSSRDAFDIIDVGSPRARTIPVLQPSHSAPPVVPESPPRPSRVNTLPKESYSRHVPLPTFTRSTTWAGEEAERMRRQYSYDDDSDGDHHHRRSRRTRSPEAVSYTYKVEGGKTMKLETPYEDYDDVRHSSRKYSGYGPKIVESVREPLSPRDDYYPSMPFPKVKQAKAYTPDDVTYSSVQYTAVPHQSNQVWA
ncbi:hypothetical protein VTK73DRAFT_9200 [Phialemonium thermophilum]|uniref:J domain-containing protein n=1 Tax=Phialemonium thermophilum TaxID=223376 RepID=A0ABR3XMF9_9PEZI